MVEVVDYVDPPVAHRGKRPIVEPEAAAETPIHLQDQDLEHSTSRSYFGLCKYPHCFPLVTLLP